MNNLKIDNYLTVFKKVSFSGILGLLFIMLAVSAMNGNFFKQGPSIVIADDQNSNSDNSSSNDSGCGSCGNDQTVDNNQPSDNISNQNDSQDNYVPPAEEPTPTPTPVPTPTPTLTPTPTPTPTPSPSPSPSKTPKPSPTPTPTPLPTPTPTPTPSTIQCPVGKIAKVVDSTIICVAQNQTQNQTQTQNNNQNQTVNQNVTATGGNSSSSSSSSSNVNVTVNNTTSTTKEVVKEVVKEVQVVQAQPQVVMQTKGDVTQLPKTGLPLAGWALASLLPVGAGFKKFGKKSEEISANSVWMERQLNS